MKNKFIILGFSILLLTGLAAASNHTGFNVENSNVDANVSVNQFGENIANISSIYYDNQSSSKTFDVEISGNVSEIVDSPSTYTLFNNESSSFPVVANIPEDQQFGKYEGNLTMKDVQNSGFNDSVNITVKVFDDVKPGFSSISISSVQATNSVDWSVSVEDNLNVSNVFAKVLREEIVNGTATGNETIVEDAKFNRESGNEWTYTFEKTDVIGQYYTVLTASDESNNTVTWTEGFEVSGLDSISVLSENFVFETIQVKDDTGFELIRNSQGGKEFSVSLENLSYGGNESVEVGVLPPKGNSPEILGSGETRSYSEEGVYELVLIHSGNNEVKGTHRVTGEVSIEKPSHHVDPVNVSVSFSGTVKNLDKPSSTCERVKEFDSCVAYSLDSARSLFDEEYNISDDEDRSFAYLIGRIPTSDVEGSDSWGDELSLTFGEYNETVQENIKQAERINDLESSNGFKAALLLWMPFLFIVVGGGMFVYYLKYGQYVSFAQSKQKIIEKASVKEPGEGLN